MRLLEAGILGIVAVDAERGSGLGKVEIEFRIALRAHFVSGVAGFATQV